MSSRQILVAVMATVSLLAPRLARAAELKIAYVDLQRAFAEVDEGKAAKARLEAARDAKQKDIDKEQDQLKKERDAFEKEKDTFTKQVATMTDATKIQKRTELERKGQELQKKLFELQQRFDKGRQELAQSERETLNAILGKMQPIIATIAQRDGFTLVFEKTDSGLLIAPPSLDLTNELVRLFNEKNKVAATPASTNTTTPKKTDTPKK